jgi:hypothetical protein
MLKKKSRIAARSSVFKVIYLLLSTSKKEMAPVLIGCWFMASFEEGRLIACLT